jgi:tubulin polyglutamylase TTLL6/13
MQRWLPEDFHYFPPTWILPQDAKDFKQQFNNKKAKTFIVKPEASCQGKGIFLTRNCEWMAGSAEHYVAQRYIHKPYLIQGFKFDLRIYVLITGVNPLRAYITKEGLARFATEKYESPAGGNLGNMMMHLTNYAINKDSCGFVYNRDPNRDDVGHKRSLKAILRHVDEKRKFFSEEAHKPSAEQIWHGIREICVKTLLTAQPALSHVYRNSKPEDMENNLCFQILGFDIFIDHQSKPWLLEVNQSPSFSTDAPIDLRIKKNLIIDTVKMLGLSLKRKQKYQAQKKVDQQKRMLTGYNTKWRVTNDEKEAMKEAKMQAKDQMEMDNKGQYELLYPPAKGDEEAAERYDRILTKAREVYEESVMMKRKENNTTYMD